MGQNESGSDLPALKKNAVSVHCRNPLPISGPWSCDDQGQDNGQPPPNKIECLDKKYPLFRLFPASAKVLGSEWFASPLQKKFENSFQSSGTLPVIWGSQMQSCGMNANKNTIKAGGNNTVN